MTNTYLAPTKPNGLPRRDRIMLYGPPDAGKSNALLTIAAWHWQLGSPAKFYVVNTDESYDALFEDERFEHLDAEQGGNVIIFPSKIFSDIYDWTKQVSKSLTDHDWLCADLSDELWAAVQNEYARKIYGNSGDIGDMWLATDGKESHPIKGWDWGYVNARFDSLVNTHFVGGKGHRLMLAATKPIIEPSAGMDEDEYAKLAREEFGHVGVKPAGQKKDPWRWDSILYVQGRGGIGNRETGYVTAREKRNKRGRLGKQLKNNLIPEPLDDFYFDYLVSRGGWKV